MIRKFKAPTMKDAVQMAKDVFGDEAVVLNSRKVKNDKPAGPDDDELVEITVTADRPRQATQKVRPFYSRTDAKPAAKPPVSDERDDVFLIAEGQERVASLVEAQRNSQDEIKKEINVLKRSLGDLREDLRRSTHTLLPETRAFLERERGLDPDLTDEIIPNIFLQLEGGDIKDENRIRQAIQDEIRDLLHTGPSLKLAPNRPKLVTMIGPTGMGKTTTIIKLATHPEFYGRNRVALVTIDTYRVAAAAQLKTFAALARIPLEIVYEPEDLSAALAKLQDYEVILIDTAGRSPLNANHLEDLQAFFRIAVPDEIHLVMSISMRSDVMLDAFVNFASLPLTHLVISKLDETSRRGNIFNISRKIDLPLSFLTNGQKVPDDILLADKTEIAHMIVE